MELGNVVRLRNFRHYTGQVMGIQTMDYTAPPGKVWLAVLIAVEDKDAPNTVKPDEALNALGWHFHAAARS
jgi:hypothetical protein